MKDKRTTETVPRRKVFWMRCQATFVVIIVYASVFICDSGKNEGGVWAHGRVAADGLSAVEIGVERGLAFHLKDGDEFGMSVSQLLKHGQRAFSANWTEQEGGGRPLSKGIGTAIADTSAALLFPRNMNRISGPDANSCAGCHNAPFGISGGGGDFVTNVFVLGQRFDFVTFDPSDTVATRGAVDERGEFATLDDIGNSRATLGMFGSGYIEMLARQMTEDLQAIRDGMEPGSTHALASKGVDFGALSRRRDGGWDTRDVDGLPEVSLVTKNGMAPSLIVRPFHQAGRVTSLREFTNNAYNHHHGIQAVERFGMEDPDGDGFMVELTRADVTAVVLYQATLAVPGRVIPRHPEIERAIATGEVLFEDIGCATCHVPSLPLDEGGWVFTEPGPYNSAGDLQQGEVPAYDLDLTSSALPPPRLTVEDGSVHVPAYTDLKLHDITDGPDDPNREQLNMQGAPGTELFFAGNSRFITRKLWGAANEPPYFHHGQFATLRQAVLAHAGEAEAAADTYRSLAAAERACVIEFLKSLQVLPPGSQELIVDEHGRPRTWNREQHL